VSEVDVEIKQSNKPTFMHLYSQNQISRYTPVKGHSLPVTEIQKKEIKLKLKNR